MHAIHLPFALHCCLTICTALFWKETLYTKTLVIKFYLAHRLTMAGVMEDSFHFICFLKSLSSWCADISLCNMKLIVGGTKEKSDCFRAGLSVRVGVWEILNKIVLFLVFFLCCAITVMVSNQVNYCMILQARTILTKADT